MLLVDIYLLGAVIDWFVCTHLQGLDIWKVCDLYNSYEMCSWVLSKGGRVYHHTLKSCDMSDPNCK